MSNLYKTLRRLLDEKGITGYRMCSDLGISKNLMTELKNGRKKTVNAETAQKIADYLGVTVSCLLGEEEEKPQVGNLELKDVIETYIEREKMRLLFISTKDLTDEEIDAAIQVIKLMTHTKS